MGHRNIYRQNDDKNNKDLLYIARCLTQGVIRQDIKYKNIESKSGDSLRNGEAEDPMNKNNFEEVCFNRGMKIWQRG